MPMKSLQITPSFTSREEASLNKYLVEISKFKIPTPDEEIELSQKIHAGDKNALDTLVQSNLRFVVSVAKYYRNQGLSLPDLINEGNLGLIEAAEKFDVTRGFKFTSYAVWWIRAKILYALAELSKGIRLPVNILQLSLRIDKASFKFETENERRPEPYELAEQPNINLTENTINFLLPFLEKTVSLDSEYTGENQDGSRADFLEDSELPKTDQGLISQSLKTDIERIFAHRLNDREADVLINYFGLNKMPCLTLKEIGNCMGLTKERVRQIKKKALKKIFKSRRCTRMLRPYLSQS